MQSCFSFLIRKKKCYGILVLSVLNIIAETVLWTYCSYEEIPFLPYNMEIF